MKIRIVYAIACTSLVWIVFVWSIHKGNSGSSQAGAVTGIVELSAPPPLAEQSSISSLCSPAPLFSTIPEPLKAEFDTRSDGYMSATLGLTSVLKKLARIPEGGAREAFLRGVFQYAATLGVPAALDWTRNLPGNKDRDSAFLTLMDEWSNTSMAEILQNPAMVEFGMAGTLGLHLLESGQTSPQEIARMADDFLHGQQRAVLLAEAAATLASTDPARALALGDDLAGDLQLRFLKRFAAGWASKQPLVAWDWAADTADMATRAALQASIVAIMAETNHETAANMALEMDPGNAARSRSLEEVAAYWAAKDTESAEQWAVSLPTQADRDAAQQGIQNAAPVGIGAVLDIEDDGIPVIRGIVPDGVAGRSAAIKEGDRILGVSDSDGTWLETRTLSPDDVINLIRGAPNTSVSLRVQSPSDESIRTVTLIREQVIHRNAN